MDDGTGEDEIDEDVYKRQYGLIACSNRLKQGGFNCKECQLQMYCALIYTPGYITRFGLVALCPVQQALPLRTFTKHSASPYLVFDPFTTLKFMKRAGYLNGRSVFRGLE
ncbi:hypothetical protein BofuT4_P114870.1 [Botrytis cinerea T4]|uniref:Uncharacterized protein n=1 Tax=Botryotinia fuckeliana (strain T4) TaxID=999810 RepID=G2Y291_BOTF4|nr:hypothetical protein BofuT4_P114870.1 [Botrytis cinerea T4]